MWSIPEHTPSIAELISAADQRVAGLKDAKARLATCIHRHALSARNGRNYLPINPIVLGPTGCLDGTTRIETIDGLIPLRELSGRWTVLRTADGWALGYGYHGGRAPMYRVEHEHGEFIATGQHRSLVERNGQVSWRAVERLRGDRLLSTYRTPPASNWVDDQSAHAEDALSFWRTVLSSLENCSGGCRLCGGLPRWGAGFFPEVSPLPDDALGCIHPEQRDGLVAGLAHIPSCQSFDLLSTQGSLPWDSHDRERVESLVGPVGASQAAVCIQAARQSRDWSNQPWLGLEYGLSIPQSCLAPYRSSRVISVTPVGTGEFYDLIVPGDPQYRTEGGWLHHNGGKSFLVHTLLEASGLPYVEINATQYSEVGYAGLDLSALFLDFFDKYQLPKVDKQADLLPLMERWGVVVLDEFDKWRVVPNPRERQPQRALQAELLRMLEGDLVHASKQDSHRGLPFRTDHVLFIALGAFEGLSSMMERTHDDTLPNLYMRAEPLDISDYGFLMELCGRFPELIALPPLNADAMTKIIRDHIWPRYCTEAADGHISLEATDAALMELSGLAISKKIGARAFGNVINQLLWRAWSQARPGDRIVVDVPAVLGREARLERAVTA